MPAGADLSARLQQPLTLVHIENADSWEAARAVAQAIQRLAACPVAVSGRFQHLGKSAGWSRIPLQPFEENAALDQLGQELELGAPAAAKDYGKLVRALGYLPLAIHLAAGHLRAGRSVAGFLSLLRQKDLHLKHPDPADPNRLLSATFELSLDLLRGQLGTDADRLLPAFHALGHGPASGFGASLGAALAELNAADFEELAVQAHTLSLLDRVPEGESWRLHPLLAELLRPRAEEAAVLARMTGWFLERLPEDTAGQEAKQGRCWDEIHREQAALVEWLARVPEADWVRVERAGSWFAMLNGPFSAWLNFCERALRHELGDAGKSNFLWTASNVAMSAGLLDRTLVLARHKAELDQSRGEEREAALALGRIADVCQARGQLDEALRIRQEEELPVYERLGDVRSRAVTLGRIADVYQARGQLDEALRIRQEEQLPVYERLGDVRERAVTLGRIADVYQARGQLDEALRIRQEEELPVYERLGDVRERAVTLGKIADVYQARGQLDEALRIRQEEELPVYERLGDVRSRAVTLGRIADVYQARGQLDEALRIRQEEELPVYERLGDVRSRAVTLGRIADVYQARGQLDEALRIRQEEQLPVYERLGDVRERAVTLGQIADVYQARGQLDEALRIRQEEELPVYERLGDVRSRAVTLGKIADVYQARGQLDEALRIRQEEELPVYERLQSARDLLICRAKIGINYLARGAAGDREQALVLLNLALQDAQQLQLPEAEQIAGIIRQVENGPAPVQHE
ncbi:MAG: tetratricopeptide repeat protein [Candidatus Competibacter sp.]